MSEWTLHLPIRDPDERIEADTLCDLPAALPPGNERELARDLLLQGRLDGLETVGEVHDRVAGMFPMRVGGCLTVLAGAWDLP